MWEIWVTVFLYVADPLEHVMPLETTQAFHDNYFRYSDFYVLILFAGFGFKILSDVSAM